MHIDSGSHPSTPAGSDRDALAATAADVRGEVVGEDSQLAVQEALGEFEADNQHLSRPTAAGEQSSAPDGWVVGLARLFSAPPAGHARTSAA